MGTLYPHLKIKENKFQFVENFGSDYCFYFTGHWGVGAGVEFNYYNSNLLEIRHFVCPGTRDVYHVDYTYKEDNEYNRSVYRVDLNRDVSFISIPLFARFQTGKTNQFLMALGGKLAIPLSDSFYISERIGHEEEVTGFDHNFEPTRKTIFMAENNLMSSASPAYKLGFLLSAECGAKWRLNSILAAHTLLYIDYGLNNIRKYRTPYYYEGVKTNDVGKFTPMQIGIKVKLGFNK